MQKRLIECVPNFSEGQDSRVIEAIVQAIAAQGAVKVLNVDPGKATNRTVVTFVGAPEDVVDAAFAGIQKAAELIDMRRHKGEHPRMGATDVCPFIPISGVSMEEAAEYATRLAKRVGEELSIPVYLYEYAQPNKERSNLSVIRAGEFEGFAEKIKLPEWKPDFGPAQIHESAGATVIGARDFLIAYNVNLNTKSTRLANRVAFDVREAGRVKREGNPYHGPVVKDESGEPVRIPGKLKAVKAIGWYIEEYGMAQISMNLTNYKVTPLHVAFEETCNSALSRGLRVTGSELVGLVPLEPMLDAGRYFLQKQGLSSGVSDAELIHTAVRSMGLDELSPFEPEKRIIEYLLKDASSERLVRMSVSAFCDETASDAPAPGGGSVSALAGALGASLGIMVANLSATKKGWEDRAIGFSDWAEQGQMLKKHLLFLVDEDTRSFEAVMNAFKLPKDTEEEKAHRASAIEQANTYATRIPLEVMKTAFSCIPLIRTMATEGNPNSKSDAAVGALCIKTAVRGAWLNVLINAKELKDRVLADNLVAEAKEILQENHAACDAIILEIESSLRA
ncbi:MAG: glutamate formimidoyltransferase [Bacteroidetes bacterium]|nr:glutamate formimidoyltransferase [Bacteroidota bacterium]